MGRPVAVPKTECMEWAEWEVYVSPKTIHDSQDFPAPTVDPLPEQVDLAAPLASVDPVPTVEAVPLPLPTAPPVDSMEGDLAAPETDSPTNLPYENALESGSSQLALDSIIDNDKTDSSPVSVEGDKSKPPCPPEQLAKFEAEGLLTRDLGIRLGWKSGSMISQEWDKGVTPEQFAQWSADKDPNGLSWWRHGVSKATRYKPFPPTP